MAGLLALLAKAPKTPPGDHAEPDADDGDNGTGKEMAGAALATALKSGDGSRIAAAFQTMLDHCSSGGGEPDADDEGTAGEV